MRKRTPFLLAIGLIGILLTGCDGDIIIPPTPSGEVTLNSIQITHLPSTTSYRVKESFSSVGLEVTANYSDTSRKKVTDYTLSLAEGYTFTAADEGVKTVIVSYESKTASFDLAIRPEEAITVESIRVTTLPNKSEYTVNDSFSSFGLKVQATLSNGTTEMVTDYTLSLNDGYIFTESDVGTKYVTVTYSGKTTSFSVKVNPQKVDPIPSEEWTLVTNASTLRAGDLITLGTIYSTLAYIPSSFASSSTSQYLTLTNASQKESVSILTDLPDSAITFVLGGTEGAWTLNYEGKPLYYNGNKKVNFTSGQTSGWTISIDSNGGASIYPNISSTADRLLFNFPSNGNPRLTTYSSSISYSMVLPSIYRGKAADPVYPTDIAVTGKTTMDYGENFEIEVTYSPAETNIKNTTFTSSNTNVVEVSQYGIMTAVGVGQSTITVRSESADNGYITKSFDVTVLPVSVTGVTLSATSKTLSVGQTFNLVANVEPVNATNKNVTWSSSDSTIASVSSEGLVTAKNKTGTALITVKTEDGNKQATCEIIVQEEPADAWTVMVYMCGSNLESGYYWNNWGQYVAGNINTYGSAATNDIEEILTAGTKPDNVNILIETGGSIRWNTKYGIGANYIERYEVTSNNKLSKKSSTKWSIDNYMGESDTLQDFITWGLENYPAERTALILWNHGGAMAGCCFDEKYENYYSMNKMDALDPNELADAVGGAFAATGRTEKLEFIGYDCCIMQVQDIAQLNSQYFNYMVASEQLENGDGWNYSWLTKLYETSNSTQTVLTDICTKFVDQYGTYQNDQCLSFLDLSRMGEYFNAFEDLANSIYSKVNKSSLTTVLNKTKSYEKSDYGLYDIGDFFNKLDDNSTIKSAIGGKVEAARTAYKNLVVVSKKGNSAGNSTGIALVYGDFYYGAQSNFTNWLRVNDR